MTKLVRSILWKSLLVTLILLLLVDVSHSLAKAIFVEPWPDNPGLPADRRGDFLVFSDSQGSFDPIWTISPHFDEMLGLLNGMDAKMAFHVGDMYTGDGTFASNVNNQAEWFLEDMQLFQIPWYPVMGNHDARGDGWQVTKEMIFEGGSTYYSFDQGNSHFVVLDAFMPGYEESLSPDQLGWLEEDLSSTLQPHIFVFVHAPLYSLGVHKGESLDKYPTMRNRLASLLVEYGVDIVFCGHEHFYACFEYDGLVQVTTGGAGGKLTSPASMHELTTDYGYDPSRIGRLRTQKSLHYVCVSTDANQITVTAYDLEGAIIDRFSVLS